MGPVGCGSMRRLLLFGVGLGLSSGKISDGQVHLSSQDTEKYLTKFSFSPREEGHINITFHVTERDYFDRHQHLLTLCLYSDADWPKFRKAMDKGSLCAERQKLATWSAKVQPEQAHAQASRHDWSYAGKLSAPKGRAHYWYAVLMDCYLEEYDAHPPPMSYRLVFLNGNSHLPADESGVNSCTPPALFSQHPTDEFSVNRFTPPRSGSGPSLSQNSGQSRREGETDGGVRERTGGWSGGTWADVL